LAVDDPGTEVCEAVIARENAGFDFASWALALRLAPELWSARTLIFANDSVYGPFGDFAGILQQIEDTPADVVGLSGSDEKEPHFQSFFFAIRGAALQNPATHRFWRNVKILGSKREVIAAYELSMLSRFSAAGLRCETLFHASRWQGDRNPTHFRWRELIDAGFPFIKVELLRDNPEELDLTGWDTLLREKGYAPQLVNTHLDAVRPDAPALQCTQKGGSASISEVIHHAQSEALL